MLDTAVANARERKDPFEEHIPRTKVLAADEDEFGYEIWSPIKKLSLNEHNKKYRGDYYLDNINWLYYIKEFVSH